MVVFTTEKVVIILGVTAIVIVLAYIFRFGKFSKRKPTGENPSASQQAPSDSK